MSIFQRTSVECPGCGLARAFDLVVSVSADRRPDLRAAILDGSFQRERCPACGVSFRVEPEFSYIDLARGQYIGAGPQARRAHPALAREAVARTQAGFDLAFGATAGGAAREIGQGLTLRVVFGWPALVEKLRAREAGLDDQALEALKVALIAQLAAAPLPGRQELRLLAADAASLRFGWVDGEGGEGSPGGVGQRLMTLPRAAIDEIAADRPAWQALLDEVVDGPVVDFQREMPVV